MSPIAATQRTPRLSTTLALAPVVFAVSATGASIESHQVVEQLCQIADGESLPAWNKTEDSRAKFDRLVERWRRETELLSSSTQMAMHPTYQQIIGMGREALPWILAELRDRPDHWFWALKAISGDDPVPLADRGVIKKMRDAWLRWGDAKQLLPK